MLLPPLSLGLAAAREEGVVRSSQSSKAIGSRKPTMRPSYDRLVASLNPASSCFSLDLREPGKNEGKKRGMGIAVLGFGLPIVTLELLNRVVFPERTFSDRYLPTHSIRLSTTNRRRQ